MRTRSLTALRVGPQDLFDLLTSVLDEDRQRSFFRPLHRSEVREGLLVPLDPARISLPDRDQREAHHPSLINIS